MLPKLKNINPLVYKEQYLKSVCSRDNNNNYNNYNDNNNDNNDDNSNNNNNNNSNNNNIIFIKVKLVQQQYAVINQGPINLNYKRK